MTDRKRAALGCLSIIAIVAFIALGYYFFGV